jgi:hypothetical protein
MISLSYLFEFDIETTNHIGKILKLHSASSDDPDHSEKIKIIKDTIGRHSSKKDLEDLKGGVNYGNLSYGTQLGRYDDIGGKNISLSRYIPKEHIKNITAHELSHHIDREDFDKEVEQPNQGMVGNSFAKRYYGHPAEFVARGGAKHVEYLENPHYVASGAPNLQDQIKNLRKTSKQIPLETRLLTHHFDKDNEDAALRDREYDNVDKEIPKIQKKLQKIIKHKR